MPTKENIDSKSPLKGVNEIINDWSEDKPQIQDPYAASSQPQESVASNPCKNLKVTLALSEESQVCNFWIGLCQKGSLHPHSLLDLETIQDILDQAALTGVTDNGPIMLSDSRKGVPKYIYLLPPPSFEPIDSECTWVNDLLKTINSWTPTRVGIYLSPQVMTEEKSNNLLKLILKNVMLQTNSSDFYLLIGSKNLNPLLNTMLDLKTELLEEKVSLSVFH